MLTHPKGCKARILLSSVFGPYAQDDEFGSRKINPMELYHNQVTREQGPFSLRMFHRSWGILMIQQKHLGAHHGARFSHARSLRGGIARQHDYDIVGISSIIVNVGKVREMCQIGAARVAPIRPSWWAATWRRSRDRRHDRRRPHRARRRHLVDAPVPG
jgi:hypothetical protein